MDYLYDNSLHIVLYFSILWALSAVLFLDPSNDKMMRTFIVSFNSSFIILTGLLGILLILVLSFK